MIGLVHGSENIKDEPVDETAFQFRILNPGQELGIKVATPVGTLFGQLFFGWLADILGRKRMCACSVLKPSVSATDRPSPDTDGVELIIMIIATFSQALAGYSPGVSILGVLIFWRFVMGVGIGWVHLHSCPAARSYSPLCRWRLPSVGSDGLGVFFNPYSWSSHDCRVCLSRLG